MSYEEYRTKPCDDIARADQLLNPKILRKPTADEVALASALIALANVKMMGSTRR